MGSVLFKNLHKNYSFASNIYLIYTYKKDLALNNRQEVICYKTQPNHLHCHPETDLFRSIRTLQCDETG